MLTIAMVPTLVPSVSWAEDDDGGGDAPAQVEEQETKKPEQEPAPAPAPAPEPAPAPAPEPEPEAPSSDEEPSAETESDDSEMTEEMQEEEALEEEEEELKKPAASFSDSAGGIAVKVSAPAGALPEGTKMKVSGVSSSQAKSIAQRAVGDEGKIRDAKGVDISFYDKDNHKIEPEKALTVTLSGAGVRGNDPAIYHQGAGGTEKIMSLSSGNGGTFHSSDFSIYVVAAEYYTVQFRMDEDDGGMLLSQIVDLSDGDHISPMPDKPFKAGARFVKWVDSATGEEVNGSTVVTGDMVVYAVFEEIKVYELTIDYYYHNPKTHEKVVFFTKKEQIERRDMPKEIASPASTSVEETGASEDNIYYPKVPVLTITEEDLNDVVNINDEGHGVFTKEVEYVPYDTHYYFVYLLKNKDGEGYTEVEREEKNGIAGTNVTPTVKNIKGGEFEKTETQRITKEGQELNVYYTRTDYTLTFDSQGGAYVEPETAPYESDVNITGKIPQRSGYDFVQWCLDPEGKQPAGNTVRLDSDKTLYASWKEKQVNYTVIYQIENADNENYSYLTSQTKKALVGTSVTVTASDTAPAALDKNNFTFKESTTATVKGDGSTVVTVKYSRNVYTIVWNGDVYNTSGKRRAQKQGSGSITGKYGSNITQKWVAAFNDPYPEYAWSFTTKNNDKIISIDTMPGKGEVTVNNGTIALNAFDFSTTKTQVLNYWLENYDGSSSTTRDGKTYGLYKTVTGKFNYLYDDADFYNIIGYTKDGYQASYVSKGKTYSYTLGSSTPSAELNVNFYYAANSYPLAFYDYDGSLISTNQVKLNDDISGYLSSNKPASPVAGAQWLGWFTDSEHTDLYKGNQKMTTGLALYAGWEMPKETITFVDILPDGTEKVLAEVTYSYGETAEAINQPAAREGYVFQGWATDKDGTARYDFDRPMTENVTVYARWKQKTLGYTVRYIDEKSGEELSDPKIVMGPLYKVGDVVKESPVDLAGMLPDQSSKELTLTMDNDRNEILFSYTKKKSEITYTVRYVLDEDESVEVAPSKTKTVSGDMISVKESAAAVNREYMDEKYAANEYYPIEEVIHHTFSSGENIITFRYASYRTTNFIIRYLDMEDNALKGEETYLTKIGGSYRVQTQIPGYTFKYVVKNGTDTSRRVTYHATDAGTTELNVYFSKDLVISAKSLKKVYDGTELKSEGTGATVVETDGLSSGHSLTGLTWEGSQTNVGTSATVPSNAVISGAPEDYYDITYVPGTLTVTASSVVVTIEGDKIDTAYDGKVHTATYHVTGISDPQFKEKYIQFNGTAAEASQTHVGRSDLILDGMFSTIREQAGNFDVTYNATDGYVSVTPKTATVHTSSAEKVYDGKPLTSHVEGTGENADWVEGLVEGETAVIEKNTGSRTKVGTSENYYDAIIWQTAQESDYTLKFDMGHLTVTKAPLTITAKDITAEYDGTAKGPKAQMEQEGVSLQDLIETKGLAEGDTVTALTLSGKATDAGTYADRIVPSEALGNDGQSLDDNYDITYVPGTITITPRDVTITAGSKAFAYDGKTHTLPEYEVDGLVGDDSIEAAITGSIKLPKDGTVANHVESYEFTTGNPSNYKVRTIDGALTMTKAQAEITIEGNSKEWTFDGEAHHSSKVNVTEGELFEGDRLIANASGSVTNVADTEAGNNPVAEGWKIVHGEEMEDVTENYAVTVKAGTLTILPKEATVTAGSETFKYDGKEHSNNVYTVRGLAGEDEITARTSGSIRFPSQSPVENVILSWEMTKGDVSNYEVSLVSGSLTMDPAQTEITIRAADDVWTYDGKSHSNPEVVVSKGTLVEGDELIAEADGSVTDVSDTAEGNNRIKEGYRIVHDGTDVTDNYVITEAAGTLEIRKRPVKITAASEEFTYDGQTHSLPEYRTEGLVGDDSIEAIILGSITWPRQRSVENKITAYHFVEGNPDNYSVTTINGVLTMKNAQVPITIEAGTQTWTYDGQPHSLPDVLITEGQLFDGDELVAEGTGEVINVADTRAGNNPIADGYRIMRGDEDVTANYVITAVPGTLMIQKKDLSITANSEVFTYDGLLHENTGYEVEGLEGNDKVKAVVSGSITLPSQSPVENRLVSWEFINGDADNYRVTTENGELIMERASIGITITAGDMDFTYDGTAHENNTVTVTAGELLPGDVLSAQAIGMVTNVADSEEENNPVAEGYRILHDGQDVTDNYRILVKAGTLTVKPKAVTIKAQDKAFVYDGKKKTWDGYDVDGLVGEDQIEAKTKGSITYPREGSVENKIDSWEFVTGDPDNYTVSTQSGWLTMAKADAAITIEAASDEWIYDGGVHGNNKVSIVEGELIEGDQLEAEAVGSVTNVADTNVGNNPVAEGWKITNDGKDVTENYAVTVKAGTLTVRPKTVTVTASSQEFTYDGTSHSSAGYDVEGLVGTDHISATVRGSITYPGQSPVVNELESWTMTAGIAENYTVAKADGELTMKDASEPVTITAASQAWTYDGEAHDNAAVTVTEGSLLPGDELIAEAGGSVTDVADTEDGNNPVQEGYRIMHGNVDVTASYVITTQAGTLTITPKPVTVTAASQTFAYDGTTHRNGEYRVDGLVGDDAIEAVVTGAITTPGQSPVVNKLKSWEFTKGTPENYEVTTEDGKLTMETASAPITIKAADQRWVYDGKTHQNDEVTILSGKLFEGDELVAKAEGSVTNVADTGNGNNPVAAGYKIMHGEEDVSDSYVITTVNGTLTIDPRPVTVTASSKEFTYDGRTHKSQDFQVEGLVGEDAIEADVIGSITYPSESPVNNKLAGYRFKTGEPGNYSVSLRDGQLTMKQAKAPITITAASQEWTYDGEAHSNSDVALTAGELFEGDTLEAEAGGTVRNVADTKEGNNGIDYFRIMHGTVDVTDNYEITAENGTLTINRQKATLKAQDKTFAYDGTAKSWPGYDTYGLIGNDMINAETTGTITYPGTTVINRILTWNFAVGDENNYEVTVEDGQLTMTKGEAEITITAASQSWTYDGSEHSNGDVAITSGKLFNGDRLIAEAEGSVKDVSDTAAGNNTIKSYRIMNGTEDVTDNYAVTEAAGTLTVEPAPLTIEAASETFTYDGEEHSNGSYEVRGLIGDDSVTVNVTGTIQFPAQGVVTNRVESYAFKEGKADNYAVKTINGVLQIDKAEREITIKADNGRFTYDGAEHTAPGVTVSDGRLFSGDELVAEADGAVTNVRDTAEGNNPIKPGYKIMHGEEDVTANYVIRLEEGTLTVDPAPVTITAGSDSFVYDGTDHSNSSYDVQGLASGDEVTAVTEGTITYVSQSPVRNVIKQYFFTIGTEDNYTVTTKPGKLTMDKASQPITITAASQTWTYDGEAHSNPSVGITAGSLMTGDRLIAEATGSVTDVADSHKGNNGIANDYKVMNGEEDVTDNYIIDTEEGDLTILPAAVTITADSEEFTYDGARHSNQGYQTEGFVGGDTINATTTGSIQFPSEGVVANRIDSYEFTKGTAENYTVKLAAGQLTMLPSQAPLTITAASQTWTFDGEAHENSGVSITSGQLFTGDELVAEASGSATNVGDTNFGNNRVSSYRILHGDEDVTACYAVRTEGGTLTIEPKAIFVKAQDKVFAYDGTEKTWPYYDVTGLVGGDSIKATVEGAITYPGVHPVANVVTSVKFISGDENNYIVNTQNGSLSMTNAEAEITVQSASQAWIYDGEVHKNDQVELTAGTLFAGDRLVAEAGGSVTNVTDTETGNNTITDCKIMHGKEDVTANYAITKEAGTLTILPKSVAVIAKNKTFTYDGTAHSYAKYDVTGLIGEDAIKATVEGSITYPDEGEVANRVTDYSVTEGIADNYKITAEDGILTMKTANEPITITAASQGWTYDGQMHENTRVTLTEGKLFEGDRLEAAAGGKVTNVADTEDGNNPVISGYRIMHGQHNVTANYKIEAVAGTLSIEPKAVTVTANSHHYVYDGMAHSDNGFDVVGLVGDDTIDAEVTGTITLPGQSPVTNKLANWTIRNGDKSNYDVSVKNGELTMETSAAPLTIKAADGKWTYDGTEHSKNKVSIVSGKLFEGDTLEAAAEGSVTNVADTAEGNNAIAEGWRIMHGDEDVTANYVVETLNGTLTVEPAPVTITAASRTFTYDGEVHKDGSYDVDGLIGEDAIEAVVSGSVCYPQEGTVVNEIESWEVTAGEKTNYTVAAVNGTLKVEEAEVPLTIEAASQAWTYDGRTHHNSEVTIKEGKLLNGDTLITEVKGKVTNVADTKNGNNKITSYQILHGNMDVTDNYRITAINGTLTINKKAAVLRAQDKVFVYDGTEKTWPEYDVSGLIGEDAIEAVVSGAVTYPKEGAVPNKITEWSFTKGDENNYQVDVQDGQLTVVRAEAEITITAASQTWTYDGNAHDAPEVKLTEGKLFDGDSLIASAEGSVTDVADTKAGNNVVSEYKIMHGEEDVTDNYAVTVVDGTLSIDPAPVTIRAASDEFTYDGQPHQNDAYKVEGLIGEDEIKAVVTGTILFPSQSSVTNKVASYEFVTGKAGNYTVKTINGELTMKTAEEALTIRAADQSFTYDGEKHDAKTVMVTEGALLPGDELVAQAMGSVTNVADTEKGNNPVAEGFKVMHDGEDVTDNYTITPVAGTLSVEPAAVTITAGSKEFVYDGTTHEYAKYKVEGLVGEDSIDAVIKGEITFASQKSVANVVDSYEFTRGEPSNYKVSTVDGLLTMAFAKNAITITAGSGHWIYDGEAHSKKKVSLTEGTLFEGDELVAKAAGSATDVADTKAGNNPVAKGYKILHGEEDVTDNYVITAKSGTLSIEPAEVIVRAKDGVFTYDGEPHSEKGYSVEGLFGDDAITAVTSGTITYPSSSGVKNVLESYEFTKGNPDNYIVRLVDGTLTMNAAEAALTITAASETFEYDGTVRTNDEVTITKGTLLRGDTLKAVAVGAVKDVADSKAGNNPVGEGYRVLNGGEDVTANYVITTEAGTLTVEPRPVTIRAESETFDYDGNAHFNPGYDVEGLVGNDVIEAIVTGSISHPDQNPVVNQITGYRFIVGNEENYVVTVEDGELRMNDVPIHDLIVHYVDLNDKTVAEDYSGSYAEDTDYGPINSPEVKGYTPEYRAVYGKMEREDIELKVKYKQVKAEETGRIAQQQPPLGLVTSNDNGKPTIQILDDGDVPLITDEGHWALLNLLFMLLTVLCSLLLLVFWFVRGRKREDGSEEKKKRHGLLRLLGLIPAAAAAILFYLTEDMTLTMVLTDQWTIAMIFLLFVEFIVMILVKSRGDDNEEEQEQPKEA